MNQQSKIHQPMLDDPDPGIFSELDHIGHE